PPGEPLLFILLGLGIGTVLGGTQSLARALFSLLIPRGREAEYFSLYQLADRGSSLLGAGMVSVVVNITGGYRTAIFSLLFFFVIGGALLWRTDLKAGVEAAGNTPPPHLDPSCAVVEVSPRYWGQQATRARKGHVRCWYFTGCGTPTRWRSGARSLPVPVRGPVRKKPRGWGIIPSPPGSTPCAAR